MDHHCPWREEAEELRERLTTLEQQVATLTRTVIGTKSEKLQQRQNRGGEGV
ncbi:hypothetical protein MYSTI_03652 [Myxococcus stipitatus DSM 14675]|uniref:Uncharacterized protein n=1 Tax=Myxococcus stipitatus (strain DSM 14675 / JCM 12634 / Mx s8) TaxID=1278073 RepID=L7UA99_MYXSD|nr:hypothetical protein MYSTI_03652 [Myxococcus stipitatus DSM 14675]